MRFLLRVAFVLGVPFLICSGSAFAQTSPSEHVQQISDNVETFEYLSRHAAQADAITVDEGVSMVVWAETVNHERQQYHHIKVAGFFPGSGWTEPVTLNADVTPIWASSPRFFFNRTNGRLYVMWRQAYEEDLGCLNPPCLRTVHAYYLNRKDRSFHRNWTLSSIYQNEIGFTEPYPSTVFAGELGANVRVRTGADGQTELVVFTFPDSRHARGQTVLRTSDTINEAFITPVGYDAYLIAYTQLTPLPGPDNAASGRKRVHLYAARYSPGQARIQPVHLLASVEPSFENYHAIALKGLTSDAQGNAAILYTLYQEFLSSNNERHSRDRLFVRRMDSAGRWGGAESVDPFWSDYAGPQNPVSVLRAGIAHTFFNGRCIDRTDSASLGYNCVYHARSGSTPVPVYRSTGDAHYWLLDAAKSPDSNRVGMLLYAMTLNADHGLKNHFFTGRLAASGEFDYHTEVEIKGLGAPDDADREFLHQMNSHRAFAVGNDDSVLISLDAVLHNPNQRRANDVVLVSRHTGRCAESRCVTGAFGAVEPEPDQPFSWTNSQKPTDVNNDGWVDALDALRLVNAINNGLFAPDGRLPVLEAQPEVFYDVDSDGYLTPRDFLMVINEINR